ncbi:MAG: ABC transporter ATP-binding protein [Sporichthyaceae bacterium]
MPQQANYSLVARLRPLLRMFGTRRRLIMVAIGSGIAHQLTLLAVAGTAAWLVGEAVTGATTSDLKPGLILLALLVAPAVLFPWLDSYLAHIAAFRILADMRARLYAAVEQLAPAYLVRRRSGEVAATAVADVELLERFYAHTISPLVVAATVPGAALIALGFVHPLLALAMIPVLLVLASIPFWFRRQAAGQGDELRACAGELSAETVDTVQGLRELVSYGGRERTIERLQARDLRVLRARSAHARRTGIEHAATDASTALGSVAVLLLAAALVSSGELDPALFPVAVVLAVASFAPVLAVVDVARELNIAAAAAARVAAILDAPVAVTDRVYFAPKYRPVARVEFDAVSFRYAPGLPAALCAAGFTVEPGETVALVGHSGAGKSTCAHLLMRWWDVEGGAIRIGGHDVRDLPQEYLRSLFSYVPQDVFLFNTSIRDNIALSRPGASLAEVQAAARVALAHDFIEALPQGYDTVAGELGSRMSGGQRQRIAIARAVLGDAPILVLDEAVSNLDTENEAALNVAMAQARTGRTAVVIAHRLSTIRAADRLVVLAGGRVVQTGTHAELSTAPGPYCDLIASQLLTST